MKSSSPLDVTFNIDIRGIDGNNLSVTETEDTSYYYFVIDWNDIDDNLINWNTDNTKFNSI